MYSLLPNNATEFEKAVERVISKRFDQMDITIRQFWNYKTCPVAFFPWLASAFSVDTWNDSWSEEQKRNSIAQSFKIHQQKGTASACRLAVEALGMQLKITEWPIYHGTPGTFRINSDTTLNSSQINTINICVNNNKNLRSHLDAIEFSLPINSAYTAAALLITETITIKMEQ